MQYPCRYKMTFTGIVPPRRAASSSSGAVALDQCVGRLDSWHCWKLAEDCPHTLAPLPAQGREIVVAGREAMTEIESKTVALATGQVDGHANRQVAAHGRVEGDQHALHRISHAGRRCDHAIDDGLAILRLSRLKEERIAARLDEVAFGEGAKQSQAVALDLAAYDERGIEGALAAREMCTVPALDIAHRIRYQNRNVEHGVRGPDAGLAPILRVGALSQHTDDCLCASEIPGTEQHDDPIAGALEDG